MPKSSDVRANLAQSVAQTHALLGKSYFVASLVQHPQLEMLGVFYCVYALTANRRGHDAEALIKLRIKHCTSCMEESQQLLKTKDLLPTIRSPLNE